MINPDTKNEILKEFREGFVVSGHVIDMPPETYEAWLAEKLQEVERKTRSSVKFELHRLNWIQCLSKAIAGRPMSFGQDPIREWRNASDQVYSSLIAEAQKEGVFPDELAQLKGVQHE